MIKKLVALRFAILCFAFFSLGLATNALADDTKTEIDWNDEQLTWFNYKEGMQQIKETGKPGLLVIYADWCPACQEHSKDFFNDKVVECLKDLVLIRVNRDTGEEINKKYDFDGGYIPRVIALNGKSEVLHELYNTDREFAYFSPTRSQAKFLSLIDKTRNYNRD